MNSSHDHDYMIQIDVLIENIVSTRPNCNKGYSGRYMGIYTVEQERYVSYRKFGLMCDSQIIYISLVRFELGVLLMYG